MACRPGTDRKTALAPSSAPRTIRLDLRMFLFAPPAARREVSAVRRQRKECTTRWLLRSGAARLASVVARPLGWTATVSFCEQSPGPNRACRRPHATRAKSIPGQSLRNMTLTPRVAKQQQRSRREQLRLEVE